LPKSTNPSACQGNAFKPNGIAKPVSTSWFQFTFRMCRSYFILLSFQHYGKRSPHSGLRTLHSQSAILSFFPSYSSSISQSFFVLHCHSAFILSLSFFMSLFLSPYSRCFFVSYMFPSLSLRAETLPCPKALRKLLA
jgi:hypothetical protein